MKEVKKEIKREVIDTHVHYEAIDGTVFHDKEECEKYEKSAFGVLMARTMDFMVCEDKDSLSTINPLDESDENSYRMLLPTCKEHIETLNMLYLLVRHWAAYVFTEEHIGQLILMGWRTCEDKLDYTWFYKMNTVIDTMTGGKYHLVPKTDKINLEKS